MRSLKTDEVVQILDLSRQSLMSWIESKKIKAYRGDGDSGVWLFDPKEVEEIRVKRLEQAMIRVKARELSVYDYLGEPRPE